MKGCRSFTDEEIEALHEYFAKRNDAWACRDKTLIFFGLYTGFRIAEVLSITISDILVKGMITDSIYLQKKNTKGALEGRVSAVNERFKVILEEYVKTHNLADIAKINPKLNLFLSRKGALTRKGAWAIFKRVREEMNLSGKVACHSTRKTYAKKCYEKLNYNLMDLKDAMGHRQIASTVCYIGSDSQKIKNVQDSLSF